MRICLVRLPSSFLINERAFPPLGLMTIGTALKLKGHEVFIHDDLPEKVPLDYDYYGMGPTTPEYSYALDVKERIRNVNPRARIVIGASFAALNRERCLSDGWDCVVIGDGELVVEQAFLGNDTLIIAEEHPLDEYPIIDRSVLDLSKYHYTINDRQATTLISSRGCPWRCAFCCKVDQKNTVRLRSAEHVIREIDYVYSLGYTAIAFPDDIFILSRSRTEAICKHLKALDIQWRCLVRADIAVRYGQDFINMMALSGCVDVGMGVESGSDTILKIANKGETVGTIKKAIRMLKSAGIRVKGFFILGLPGESPETLMETDSFLSEMQLDDIDIKVYQPYPGSPIWENRDKLDIQWHDMELAQMFYKGRLGEYYGNISTSSLTNEQISNAMVTMEKAYKHAC